MYQNSAYVHVSNISYDQEELIIDIYIWLIVMLTQQMETHNRIPKSTQHCHLF